MGGGRKEQARRARLIWWQALMTCIWAPGVGKPPLPTFRFLLSTHPLLADDVTIFVDTGMLCLVPGEISTLMPTYRTRRCTETFQRSAPTSRSPSSRTSRSSSWEPLSFSRSISQRKRPSQARLAPSACANHASSLPKSTVPVREVAVASVASLLGGFGVVALFCSVGVYV